MLTQWSFWHGGHHNSQQAEPMLILSRGVREAFVIHDDIEVEILGIENGKVRLGIKAPAEVPVCRKEKYLERKGQPLKSERYARLKLANPDYEDKAA
jgi:carbon storage regulator